MVAALAAAALSGCANVDFDNRQAWFAKPFELVSRSGGYTFSELQETKQHQRPITPSDLVDASGSCPAPQAAPATAQAQPGGPPAAVPAPQVTDTNSLLGGGIALGMSECDVVFRAGPPSSVQLGNNPNGDRTAVLTFNSGPRPGVYRFERGQLTELNLAPGAAPMAAAPTAKKKPAKSAKSQKKNEQS